MIGSKDLAQAALRGELEELARGSERRVHRVADVVYKVDLDGENANRDDYGMYRGLAQQELPPGVRLPEMARYDLDGRVVLAAEFVLGEPVGACPPVLARLEARDEDRGPCPATGLCIDDDLARRLFVEFGVTDLCFGNLLRSSDGTIWLIDLY